jgi:hypothetical protein
VPETLPGIPARRTNDGVNAIARFDVNLGEAHTSPCATDYRRNAQDAQRNLAVRRAHHRRRRRD